MTALLTVLRAAWPYLACLAIGAAAAGGWQGLRIDALTSAHDAEVARLHQQETKRLLVQAEVWRAEIQRKADLADDIDRARAAATARQARQLKETQDALKAVTTGRPCLGGAALRVLDQPTGLRPAAGAALLPAGALQDPAARPAADPAHQGQAGDGGEYATDTDIAGWIATARDLYEQCRGRLADIELYDDGGGQ